VTAQDPANSRCLFPNYCLEQSTAKCQRLDSSVSSRIGREYSTQYCLTNTEAASIKRVSSCADLYCILNYNSGSNNERCVLVSPVAG